MLRYRILITLLLGCASFVGCNSDWTSRAHARKKNPPQRVVTISVIGTNDLHGRIERTAVFGGYVKNLREARKRDRGGVVVIDAGDMFQGTLESNLGEGAGIVRAYNAIGYAAATIGNHEFDYGPVGASEIPQNSTDNPRGALLARAQEANFPFLAANLLDKTTHQRVSWPHVRPSILLDVAGVSIGVIGVTTKDTLSSTIAANVSDLELAPITETVTKEAKQLRTQGARLIIVTAHAGGDCPSFRNTEDTSSCDPHDQEIFNVARELEQGLVDIIIAGHTHAGVAHRVNGVAIIESFANGTAFGRIDVKYDRVQSRVTETQIYPPKEICKTRTATLDHCEAGTYEGASVQPDEHVLTAVTQDLERARAEKARPLGITLATELWRNHTREAPLGNLICDLMHKARPNADVVVMNGGTFRVSLPAGELVYGSLFETIPFDNRFATIRMRGSDLRGAIRRNLKSDRGIISVSGIRAVATCENGDLTVEMRDEQGHLIPDNANLKVLTNEFLATGGDGVFTAKQKRPEFVEIENGLPIRDVVATEFGKLQGPLTASDPAIYDAAHPRLTYSGQRPVRCPRP